MKDRVYKSIDFAGCKKNPVAPVAPVYFVIDTIFM
jgi:hypothetical protein